MKNEKIVIVHGGGKDVTNIATKLGKEQRFIVSPQSIESRYTDKRLKYTLWLCLERLTR